MATKNNKMRKCYCNPNICPPEYSLEHSELTLHFPQKEHITSGHTDVNEKRPICSDRKRSV